MQTTEEPGGEESDFGVRTEAWGEHSDPKVTDSGEEEREFEESTEARGEESDLEASSITGNATFEGEGDSDILTPNFDVNGTRNVTEAAEIPQTDETQDQFGNVTDTASDTDGGASIAGVELTLCDHVDIVGNYSSLVISTPPLRTTYQYRKRYNTVVQNYNEDLDKAKNNSLTWSNSDSIVSGLKKTYQMVSEYKTEFQRKLDVNKRELVRLSTAKINKKYMQNLQDDIKNLGESIREAEQALVVADNPGVQSFFQRVIESKRRELEEKRQDIKSNNREGRLLKERLSFLEYVKKDAVDIENLGEKWLPAMESLLNNLRGDNEAFTNYVEKTRENINALNRKIEKIQATLIDNEEEKESKEEEKELLDAEVLKLTEENKELASQNLELITTMKNKTELYNKKRRSICKPEGVIKSYVKANASATDLEVACNRFLEARNIVLDLSAEQDQLDRQRERGRLNRAKVTLNLGKIETLSDSLNELFQEVYPMKQKIEDINMELTSLEVHATDLRNLEEGSEAAITSLIRIKTEFQLVSEPFAILGSDFHNLINEASAADTDDRIHSQMEAINEGINDILAKLEQMHMPHTQPCFN